MKPIIEVLVLRRSQSTYFKKVTVQIHLKDRSEWGRTNSRRVTRKSLYIYIFFPSFEDHIIVLVLLSASTSKYIWLYVSVYVYYYSNILTGSIDRWRGGERDEGDEIDKKPLGVDRTHPNSSFPSPKQILDEISKIDSLVSDEEERQLASIPLPLRRSDFHLQTTLQSLRTT